MGVLNCMIDCGMWGISFLLNSMVFNVFSTVFEIVFVSGILFVKCGLEFVMLIGGMIVMYIVFMIVCM